MDVVERIKAELGGSPVVLFMKGTPDFPQCGFSAQTVAALRAVGAEFHYVNIFEEPEMREVKPGHRVACHLRSVDSAAFAAAKSS